MDRVKTVLITGGAGFIGSHVADALLEKGYRVAVVDDLSTGEKKNLNPKAVFYKLDIRSSHLSRVFKKEKPQAVFHYAAQIDVRKSVEDPARDSSVNIGGSLNVLENCRKFGVKKIIFASSGGTIYGDAKNVPTPESYPAHPLSPYGVAKLAAEQYFEYYSRVFGLAFVSLRFANVYGPRQNAKGEAGAVAIFTRAMLRGKRPAVFGNGKQTRDFIFVQDVVRASMLALQKKETGVFNVGTAKETSVNALFAQLQDLTGFSGAKIHGKAKQGEQRRSCLSYEKAFKKLGWRPRYGLEKGLQKTVEWYKNAP